MLLRLGHHDSGSIGDAATYLARFHDWRLPGRGFRAEKDGEWFALKSAGSAQVHDLQEKLRRIGFYPRGEIDGIYGYRTRAAVRLFQEYVRAVEGRADIGAVDGKAGDNTQAHIDRWVAAEQRPAWGGPSDEYRQALDALRGFKKHFMTDQPKGIELLNQGAAGSSSRAVADWTYDEADLHLVGIRRGENKLATVAAGKRVRSNDDIFVLLVNGMRLVFRGSTDPSPNMAKRPDQAFLLRGQHEYRFGWHKVGGTEANPGGTRVYRAFKPRGSGPLVVRTRDDVLTESSFHSAAPNASINIHWSGAGTTNWSAGCQVIAGLKYVDFRGELVDLDGRAARSYGDLSGTRTRGAYNVLTDVLDVFAEDDSRTGDTLLYTLLYEADVRAVAKAPIDFDAAVELLS
jgi:hypothetical protein